MTKIFLLGLPGSGKTTLGRALADLLRLPFVDLDEEITNESGKSISSIFAEEGEEMFRKKESIQLLKWCESTSGFVMATGGGTPCFFDNMKVINKAGTSIFLDVAIDDVVSRMNPDMVSIRPLLNQKINLRESLQSLFKKREIFYRQATHTLQGGSFSAEDVKRLLNS